MRYPSTEINGLQPSQLAPNAHMQFARGKEVDLGQDANGGIAVLLPASPWYRVLDSFDLTFTEKCNAGQTQTVTVTDGSTTHAYKLAYGGVKTTGTIAFDATAATVKTALETIAALTGNVDVAGSAGGPYTVKFIGSLGNTVCPLLTAPSADSGDMVIAIAQAHTLTQAKAKVKLGLFNGGGTGEDDNNILEDADIDTYVAAGGNQYFEHEDFEDTLKTSPQSDRGQVVIPPNFALIATFTKNHISGDNDGIVVPHVGWHFRDR